MRLSSNTALPSNIKVPQYNRASLASGIVHLGLGAFHRSHQAVYTDDALAANGGNWKITAINIRSTDIVDNINEQDGLFTLLSRGAKGDSVRVIGSISQAIAASREVDLAIASIAKPETKVISLTLTEKGYYIDRSNNKIDINEPLVIQDIKNINQPQTGIGLLVAGLIKRYNSHKQPVTLMCCDNLPDNGNLLRGCVLGFAEQIDNKFKEWVEENTSFPSSMVDRITPKTTEKTLTDILQIAGYTDLAAIECEDFSQWVIEDNFITDRPSWGKAGAIFVKDIAPYELTKLRMLNGTHSLIAYLGHIAGFKYVRDIFDNPSFIKLIEGYLHSAAQTLPPLGKQFNLEQYKFNLVKRFANPAIAHETYQIAMDGTEKLPQRILSAACDAIDKGQDTRSFAFVVAAWMRYCMGYTDSGKTYELRDPQEVTIKKTLISCEGNAKSIVTALQNLQGLFPSKLINNTNWSSQVTDILDAMLYNGMLSVIEEETQ